MKDRRRWGKWSSGSRRESGQGGTRSISSRGNSLSKLSEMGEKRGRVGRGSSCIKGGRELE